jgi:hypothetical protein
MNIKGIKANIKKNLVKKAVIATGVTVSAITIITLVKKNRKLHKDLHTALEGYLTLANELAIVNGYELGAFLNRLEELAS